MDTGSTRGDGTPLTFEIADEPRLDPVVDAAIIELAEALPIDVSALVVDGDPADGVDATALVSGIVAVRADPEEGVRAIDREAATFLGAVGAVRLYFELEGRSEPPSRYDAPCSWRCVRE